MDKLGSADDIDGPEVLLFREYDYGSKRNELRPLFFSSFLVNDLIAGVELRHDEMYES